MAEFVKIVYGDAPVTSKVKNTKKVCFIGRTTSYSGLIDGINDASTLVGGDYPGIMSTDPLYLAALHFLANAGGGADVILYAIPSSASNVERVEMVGTKNYTNRTFWTAYSPVDSMSTFEFQPNEDTYLNTYSGILTGTWITVSSGISLNSENGIYNGAVTLHVSGIQISGSAGGLITGVYVGPNDRLRCTVDPSELSLAFKALVNPDYGFQFFAFAYDPGKECPANPAGSASYKYASGLCLGGKSWLHDLFIGAAMAKQFNAEGQYTIFCHSLPEKMNPSEYITGSYCTGTSSFTTPTTYDNLKSLVGVNKFVATFSAEQTADATSIDPAVEAMAVRMKASPRLTMTFAPTAIPQTTYPDASEVGAWRDAQVNPVIMVKGLSAPTWGNNHTFGAGTDRFLNHIQCKNLLAQKIKERLNTLLASRKCKYDIDGIRLIKGTIVAALTEAYNIDGIIDGVGAVTIPIESYLANEASLSEGDQTILDAARDSGLVDNISIAYTWNGDVEKIYISALVAA